MSLRSRIAAWLDPEMAEEARRHWYLRGRLTEAAEWLGVDFPVVDAVIHWVKVSEVHHFWPIDKDLAKLPEHVPGKPWIRRIGDFREHLRQKYEAPPMTAPTMGEQVERLREALEAVISACDQGRMIERGAGGMSIDAQIRRSVYNGVPAWPIEEARAIIASLPLAGEVAEPVAGEVTEAGWRSMDHAPRDGTEIQARIPGNGSDNVIAWQTDAFMNSAERSCGGWAFTRDQEPPDCWTDGICWEVNEDGVASVQPEAWKPLPARQSQPVSCSICREAKTESEPAAWMYAADPEDPASTIMDGKGDGDGS